ncbi:MAG: methylenetetrahydrofolate--tRNA-(uracil(54)-C(5))-methyltransferase (FADH(2)-oxidizing) TrmFO [Coriobacteriales bacterium]|jgi:methylenetetrahydrofolate--tRNA-(uracil-5-)-methyltransferase|nr:methylenetetrahydrofolate--tRNA-(uracil(54)-C(5))-methyltransferase (FADH(2)-oxidizing) TrmFO [Coriobacteriales bacterium]
MGNESVAVIGAGLAGSEAAWQLAARGIDVRLFEMRPGQSTPAHTTGHCAELVCSNSFKGLDAATAAGALKHELALMGSRVLKSAFEARVPAGGALAVDRELFTQHVTQELAATGRIELIRREVTSLDAKELANSSHIIVATGPLTSASLSHYLMTLLGSEALAFFDAAAPIVTASSLDRSKLFAQSRYDKNGADYLNAPLDKEEYERLVQALITAQRVILKDFERRELFQACQPVEEVARTGADALRFGALKPVGLTNPATGQRPWAVVQLRPENAVGTAYNLVGFQTNLTFPEQRRVFSMIPGLEKAEFARLGVMHRNTFIDAPRMLDAAFALPGSPRVRFAGQLTGTEGYTEAIGSGLLAALNTYAQVTGTAPVVLPASSVFGALVHYATSTTNGDYQPMHVNYGIMPPLPTRVKNKRERYAAYAQRAQEALRDFIAMRPDLMFQPPVAVPALLP